MENNRTVRALEWSLLAFALLMPLSIALVQPAAYAAALIALYLLLFKRARCPVPFPYRRAVFIFLGIIVVTAFFGVRPVYSFEKMNRFLLFAAAWGIPYAVMRGQRGDRLPVMLCMLFVLGAAAKAYYDFIRVPMQVQMGTPIFETANMRDPQFYYAALCIVVGLLISRRWTLRYPPTLFGLLAVAGGLIIHFKRGAWASCICALGVMAVASRRWRTLGVSILLVGLLIALPQTRERLADLQSEFDPEGGGRLTLWTQVAPALMAAHPTGMGWKGVKHEDFLAVTDNVEKNLNHLHNNFLQVTLETSVVGLAAWGVLMAMILVVLYRKYRKLAGNHSNLSGVALGLMGAFTGLMVNGLVEYNFGDSEIFMLIVLIMGISAALPDAPDSAGSVAD